MHSKSFCPFSAPFPTLSLGHQILDDLLDSYFIVFSFAHVSNSTTKWHHYTTSLERADFSNIFCHITQGMSPLSFSGCSSSACQVLWVLSHPMMFQWWEAQMPSEGQLSSWWSPSWRCIFPHLGHVLGLSSSFFLAATAQRVLCLVLWCQLCCGLLQYQLRRSHKEVSWELLLLERTQRTESCSCPNTKPPIS